MRKVRLRPVTKPRKNAKRDRLRWRPGGYGVGGVWVLELRGRATEVPVHGREKKDLDELCSVKSNAPRKWDHCDHPGTPKRDAF